MFGYILLILTPIFALLNLAFCSIFMVSFGALRAMLPGAGIKRKMWSAANYWMWVWASGNKIILSCINKIEWQIEGQDQLKKEGWYLLISNHLSWADVVVLCCVFKDKIPMPKFFLKKELIYVPFVGACCWALGMPFMQRYSRKYLLKHPHKRGKDLETTKKTCQKFKTIPTTIVNYVEGTRFREEKRKTVKSPYNHLLPPKTAGIGYALTVMGEQFEQIIDVTLAYPDNKVIPFKDLLMGKMKRVVVHIKVHPAEKFVGDYFKDKNYKVQLKSQLHEMWQEKDLELAKIYQEASSSSK